MAPPSPSPSRTRVEAVLDRYWRFNLRLTLGLLAVWALVGLGAGILFADTLNAFTLPGTHYPLGFWFAQQGSIVAFVLLILIYALALNRLDRQHHAELEEAERSEKTTTEVDA